MGAQNHFQVGPKRDIYLGFVTLEEGTADIESTCGGHDCGPRVWTCVTRIVTCDRYTLRFPIHIWSYINAMKAATHRTNRGRRNWPLKMEQRECGIFVFWLHQRRVSTWRFRKLTQFLHLLQTEVIRT